ncbi:hypothetical protein [Dietzia papillomatosis]|nr:hypothetical protein [Dietzia papillomatosis]
METLTMQQVAALAGVKRPVVSVWRSRSAGSEHPFPAPVDPARLVFSADEVGSWLRVTGRGNNPDAHEDAALFSSLMDRAASQLDDASALLLLHALSGTPLAEQGSDDLAMLPVGHAVESVLSVAQADKALRDADLVACVDHLAEAGVTATRVLERLALRQEEKDAPLASESLTAKGDALACEVVAALAGDSDRALVPWGPGGLRLLACVVARSSESDRPRVVAPDDPTGPVDRLFWRYLAALGARLESATAGSATLLVGQWSVISRDRTESFFDTIDDVVLGLEPGSAAVVFAPAPLLVDESSGTDHRRRILSGTGGGYVAPLRYVARLPRGLCRFGGRRRMALWVLGESGDTAGARSFTTFGEHSAHALDSRENRALASDAVAALRGGAARRSHAFLRAEHRLTDAVVVRSALALPVTTDVAEDGGDALARLWEKRDASASGVLDGVEVVAAGSAADHSLPWRAATTGKHRPARVITGVRIPAEVFAAGPGGIGVIGPDEVRGRCAIGSRSVDLVELVRRAPRFRLTEPGDVVFTTTRGPAAIIDTVGGNAVQAPARVLRCLEPVEGSRRILPELAVRDISVARGSDCRSWRLRTVVVDACGPWRTVAARAAEHRARLLAELSALDALTTELSDGLAAGTLRIYHNYSEQNNEENA